MSQCGRVKGSANIPRCLLPPRTAEAFSITVLTVCRLPQGACLPRTLPAVPSAQTSASDLSRNLSQGRRWHTNPALGWSLLTHGPSSGSRPQQSGSMLAAPTWWAPQLSRDKPIPPKPRESPRRTVSHLFVLLNRFLWWLRPLTLF